jgi:hypothetical protein
MYLDGFLPEEGGVNNQPALLVEYLETMKQVKNILDKEDYDRMGEPSEQVEPEARNMVSLLRR